jgi:hypothetical protein
MAAAPKRRDDDVARDPKSEARSDEQRRGLTEEGIEDLEVSGENVVGGQASLKPNEMAR